MGLCIVVATGFHVVSFMLVSVANKGMFSPSMAAWLPVVVAGGAGLWLFGRMHS
jgi:lipopolysaccharide export LptBFGC system permease protein LptF